MAAPLAGHTVKASPKGPSRRGLRRTDPNGGVEVVGLGTDHRLSLSQNPVLLAGQIAIFLASCNRDVARLLDTV